MTPVSPTAALRVQDVPAQRAVQVEAWRVEGVEGPDEADWPDAASRRPIGTTGS